MKVILLITSATILFFGCTNQQGEAGFTSFKIFSIYSADTPTVYNKDLGVGDYLYYAPERDSFLCRYSRSIGFTPMQTQTYVGHFNNHLYVDTLTNLIRVLKRYKNGMVPNKIPGGSIYCGPQFYVEYYDKKGEHYQSFILDGNDTLEQFNKFFNRMENQPWSKKLVSNTVINSDREVVTATRKLGLYDSIEAPYIPLPCGSGIDATKIYGAWRSVGYEHNRKLQNYVKITFKQNGDYLFERIIKGSETDVRSGRFTLNKKTNTLDVNIDSKEYKFTLQKLSGTCLEYIKDDGRE